MRNKKRIIILIAITGFIAFTAIRIYMVNKDVTRIKTIKYPVNTEVNYDDNITLNTSNSTGYSIKIEETQLLTVDELCKKYNITLDREELIMDVKYVYIVKAVFKNKDNTNSNEGIFLNETHLVGKNYMIYMPSTYIYQKLNSHMPNELAFALRENSSSQVLLPYEMFFPGFNEKDTYNLITKNVPALQITSYPVKKIIKLN